MYADNQDKFPTGWSPDGKLLMFMAAGGSSSPRLRVLRLEPQSAGAPPPPAPFPPAGPGSRMGVFSPDGRWVAYVSSETQSSEVFIAPFSHAGGKRQISTSGGVKPRWRQDGKELFYLSPDGRLMATEVRLTAEAVEVGATRALVGGITTANGYAYDLAPDGRILAALGRDLKSAEPITLVQNWTAALTK